MSNSYPVCSLGSCDICIQFGATTINGVQEVRVVFNMRVLSAGEGERSTVKYLAVTMPGAQLLD
jgi:hypothetical protein